MRFSIRSGFGLGLVFLAAACATSGGPTIDASPDPLIAETETGRVMGVSQEETIAFKGIPFAKPPVGALRWRAPQPAESWEGVRTAADYGADCMQIPFAEDAAPLRTEPAEDCLYLNVWKPEDAAPGDDLPVLVWIYGGGWVNGGTSPAVYDGTATAEEGVIVVSFNYRLGRFGFFAHPALSAADEDDGLLGNYGYMDQVAALEWVRDNIEAFGGDPANVTIMGESAGGGSVANLMTIEAARGLFQRAVAMSAPVRMDAVTKPLSAEEEPDAEKDGLGFAQWAGIEGPDAAALDALRAFPAETVVAGTGMMTRPVAPTSGPMIDGVVLAGAGQVLRRGGQARVPVMAGAVSDDIGFGPPLDPEALFAEYPDPEAARVAYGDLVERPDALLKAVYEDRLMQEPARFLVEAQCAVGEPGYYYRYGYVPMPMRDEWAGMPHANEIPFFLNTAETKYGDELTEEDTQAADTVNAYLVNFVKSGDPNGESLPAWPACSAGGEGIMMFSNSGAAFVEDPLKARLDVTKALANAN